ncbi:beta-lactamase class A [Actinoplanes campanulatus]|uniref:Beta-lactamase n=1 Tax=Actinoplanes campanulatus TaxID=113559 RepID=A0A7W5AG89_9ACTN|nr:serine hydrolase [Actinoplanes campanulatus]MBB3095761.1 beta-lactamase class A [Actinoplanes campanulatus]GGN11332.1 serine hydrolase [Actinoplanes campanulatus]GID36658.1 serine hydrolase [Actinoplanes campanulatus]
MSSSLSRRSALGIGAAAVVGAGVSGPAEAAPSGTRGIRKVYEREKAKAGGLWRTHIAAVDSAGVLRPIVEDDADHVTNGYSVQKLAVATAVMDKIDRGLLSLGTKLDLPADIILGGSGIYHLHRVWGDQITVANFLTAMLLVSDNTAVRMCGRVVPALEINEILAAKGFVHTRVEPVANPNRFFLGTTTPREMHDLLWRLATKTLLKPESCDFLLSVTRWLNGYHDGVRRVMSSRERERVATKYGADFNSLGESRHEVGIMFGVNGSPLLTYAMFADGLGDPENYGATHPAVEAHAKIGRALMNSLPAAPAATARSAAPRTLPKPFHPVNGG